MSRRAKTSLKWLAGVAVGAVFIYLSALDWPLSTLFGSGLSLDGSVVTSHPIDGQGGWRFDLLYLVPYVAILTVIHFLRVIRWYPLLRPVADIGFWRLNRVSAVGNMYLFILPFRLGELARPYLIAQGGDVQMSEALGTIVVERVVDGLIVSLILFFVLFFLPTGEGRAEIEVGAWLAMAVFGGAMGVLVAAHLRRAWTLRVLDRMIGWASRGLAAKVRGLLESFLDGLGAIPNPRYFWSFIFYSLVYWILNGYGYYILAHGFASLHIPLLAAYAMMCCVIVGMMLPNPPANVGVFWFFLLKPLALYGVAAGDPAATAFGLLAWLGQFSQQTVFGLWFVGRVESATIDHDRERAPDLPRQRRRPAM